MRPDSVRRWEATAVAAALPAAAPSPALPGLDLRQTVARWASRLLAGVCGLLVILVVALSVLPHLLPVQTFAVLSGSMEPTIPVGAIVVATPVPAAQLRLGDVITFQNPNHPDRLVTHRIRGIAPSAQGPLLRTQGDANPAPDAWVLQATQAPVYRYLFQVPYLGYLVLASQTAAVRIAVAVAGALAFALLWMRRED